MHFARLCAVALTTLFSAVAAHAADPAFKLVIDTTKTGVGSSDDHHFTLPLNTSYGYDCTVDWGDGSTSEVTSNTSPTHTYAGAGTYTVAITEHVVGGFPAISFDGAADATKVVALSNWGDVTWATLHGAFGSCSNLVITATDEATARTGGVTDCSFAWSGCTSMTSFPLIDTAAVANFSAAWASCQGLTSFPALDTGHGVDFSSTWSGCSGLTSFPALDTAQGEIFSTCWASDLNLTDFPAIDTSRGIYFNYAWYDCTGLVSFPSLDLHGMQQGLGCFANDTLPITAYDQILNTIVAGHPQGGVSFDGGYATRYGAAHAHDALTTTYGWAIRDGGLLLPLSGPTWAEAHAGMPFSYHIAGSATTVMVSGLPAWLTYDAGTRTLSGTAPGTPGIDSFTIAATSVDGDPVNATVTIATFSAQPFTLMINTRSTAPGSSANNQFTLPLRPGYAYDFTVEWGDGTAETITSDASPTHSYDTPAFYFVAISENTRGGFPTIYFNGTGECRKVWDLRQWGTNHWLTLNNAFASCDYMGMTATDAATADTAAVSDFTAAWSNCQSITQFPALDTSAGTSFNGAWMNCTALTAFPLLDTSSATSLQLAWANCSGLTSFPLIDTHAVTDFNSTWSNCTNLTSFPALVTSAGQDFGSAWSGDSALTGFPQIDTASATSLHAAWSGCTGLTSFPTLDTAMVTDFSYAWSGDSAIADFPVLDLHAMSDGTSCFTDVTLPLDTYDRMLVALADGSSATGVIFDAGTASRYTTATAHAQLTSGSGWTITDGGVLPLITSPDHAAVTVDAPFHYQVGITSDLSTWAISGLPAWLTYDSGTGVVEGTAPQTAGSASFTITATALDGTVSDLVVTLDVVADPALVLAIDTTQVADSGSDDHQFTLPLHPGYTYDCTVAWGDGSSEVVTSDTSPTHTYATPGYYRVAITENSVGGFPTIYFYQSTERTKLLELRNWGANHWLTLDSSFAGCTALVITAADGATADTASVTDFTNAWAECAALTSFPLIDTSACSGFLGTWYGCSSLTSFPAIDTGAATFFASTWQGCSGLTSFPLLATANATSFDYAWQGCSGLSTFPAIASGAATGFRRTWQDCAGLIAFPALDTANGLDFTSTWQGCSSLTAFPALDLRHGEDFTSTWEGCSAMTSFATVQLVPTGSLIRTWRGCSSLTEFPLLDTSAVVGMGQTWQDCSSLTEFPPLDTHAVQGFSATWDNCSSLTAFPLLDTAAATSFNAAWRGCSGLTAFPVLATTQGTDFSDTWNGCSAIVGFPYLDLQRMTAGNGCFHDVVLSVATYDRILAALDSGSEADGVHFDAGAANRYSPAAAAAHDQLTGAHHWLITDGGVITVIYEPHILIAALSSAVDYVFALPGNVGPLEFSGLPAWMSYDPARGIITGTAPASVTQTTFTVTSHDAGGAATTSTITIYVNDADAPVITAPAGVTYVQGGTTLAGYQIVASHSPTLYGASGLPSGLTLDVHSGLISGTSSSSADHPYTVTLTASNAAGSGAAVIQLSLANTAAPHDDPGSSGSGGCGLGGGVALFLLCGLTAIGRGTHRTTTRAARR